MAIKTAECSACGRTFRASDLDDIEGICIECEKKSPEQKEKYKECSGCQRMLPIEEIQDNICNDCYDESSSTDGTVEEQNEAIDRDSQSVLIQQFLDYLDEQGYVIIDKEKLDDLAIDIYESDGLIGNFLGQKND